MATQPITAARKRPHRLFNLDVGVVFLTVSQVSHGYAHETVAVCCGVIGVAMVTFGGYQAIHQTVRRPVAVPVSQTEATAETRVSRPHRS
jgi:uncharacterized membrane protein